jgi:hypothetical protein
VNVLDAPQVDEDTTVLDDLDFEPRCEARAHGTGTSGHVVDEPAAFLVVAPCGASRMMCAAWVASTLPHQKLVCVPGCRQTHSFTLVKFIPL